MAVLEIDGVRDPEHVEEAIRSGTVSFLFDGAGEFLPAILPDESACVPEV
jgi:hypothetical protein